MSKILRKFSISERQFIDPTTKQRNDFFSALAVNVVERFGLGRTKGLSPSRRRLDSQTTMIPKGVRLSNKPLLLMSNFS